VLGMAVTRMLLSENFRVVIHDSSVDALNDFVAELGSAAKRDVCYPICFDPSNSEAVAAAVARIDADAWPVYVLINNSGILSNTLVEETSIDEWRNVFAQNVDSAFLLSRALLPAMRKRKWGRIVNTCSLAGKTGGVTTGVAYSTTKGALQTLTFALARESAKDGITVNGIAPAYIRTPTVETYPEDVVDMLLRYIPVSRFCEPEEFAHVVRFLISPMSGFITGEIIGTFGGLAGIFWYGPCDEDALWWVCDVPSPPFCAFANGHGVSYVLRHARCMLTVSAWLLSLLSRCLCFSCFCVLDTLGVFLIASQTRTAVYI